MTRIHFACSINEMIGTCGMSICLQNIKNQSALIPFFFLTVEDDSTPIDVPCVPAETVNVTKRFSRICEILQLDVNKLTPNDRLSITEFTSLTFSKGNIPSTLVNSLQDIMSRLSMEKLEKLNQLKQVMLEKLVIPSPLQQSALIKRLESDLEAIKEKISTFAFQLSAADILKKLEDLVKKEMKPRIATFRDDTQARTGKLLEKLREDITEIIKKMIKNSENNPDLKMIEKDANQLINGIGAMINNGPHSVPEKINMVRILINVNKREGKPLASSSKDLDDCLQLVASCESSLNNLNSITIKPEEPQSTQPTLRR